MMDRRVGIAIGIAVLLRNHLHVFSVVINSLSHKSCATQLNWEFVGTTTGVAQLRNHSEFSTPGLLMQSNSLKRRGPKKSAPQVLQSHHNGSVVVSSGNAQKSSRVCNFSLMPMFRCKLSYLNVLGQSEPAEHTPAHHDEGWWIESGQEAVFCCAPVPYS